MKYSRKYAYYFSTKPLEEMNKLQLLRKIGEDTLSPVAKLKLEWIIFYYTVGEGNALKTAKHFGINPKTFHKWKKRFNEKNLSTLEEASRAPRKTRTRNISFIQRDRIRKLRKKHIRWGKMKLRNRYLKMHGETISSWKFQKVIEEENLYFDKLQIQKMRKRKKQAQIQPKRRIHTLLKENKTNFLWHVDTVIFTLSQGGYRYLLTAIDEVSKLAYARLYTTHSSKQAADYQSPP